MLITGHFQKIDHRKPSKTWVSKAQYMSLTENSNQVFLPAGGGGGGGGGCNST